MYESFFGFTCKPFQLTPDPEFLFMSSAHKRALTYLNYGIAENSGFILVTGEIGAGKTTVIRTIMKTLKEDIRLARVNNTRVSSEQLISMINEDFGIDTKGKDKTIMLSDLTDFLVQQYAQGARSMIIIDEAQNLSSELLEEIRMLSNLETDKSKLLQIVLLGQPELNITLSRPELEQLRQRITTNTHIGSLNREETEAYIMHRLRVAGNVDAVKFEEGVMDVLYEFSKGIPRMINIICDFTLLAAFVDGRKSIDMELIRSIISDFISGRPETKAASIPFASAEISAESARQDDLTPGQLKKALSSIHFRIQNLEAIINGIKGKTIFHETKKLLSVKDEELRRKEEELIIKENELTEKEELLRKREESVRNLFESNIMKGISSERF
jgi:putative secretion ATPase (PEP-CTERM system associated)